METGKRRGGMRFDSGKERGPDLASRVHVQKWLGGRPGEVEVACQVETHVPKRQMYGCEGDCPQHSSVRNRRLER